MNKCKDCKFFNPCGDDYFHVSKSYGKCTCKKMIVADLLLDNRKSREVVENDKDFVINKDTNWTFENALIGEDFGCNHWKGKNILTCVACGKEIGVDDKYYEVDVYRFRFGPGTNYLTEVMLCEECFNKSEKEAKEKDLENNKYIVD